MQAGAQKVIAIEVSGGSIHFRKWVNRLVIGQTCNVKPCKNMECYSQDTTDDSSVVLQCKQMLNGLISGYLTVCELENHHAINR